MAIKIKYNGYECNVLSNINEVLEAYEVIKKGKNHLRYMLDNYGNCLSGEVVGMIEECLNTVE